MKHIVVFKSAAEDIFRAEASEHELRMGFNEYFKQDRTFLLRTGAKLMRDITGSYIIAGYAYDGRDIEEYYPMLKCRFMEVV